NLRATTGRRRKMISQFRLSTLAALATVFGLTLPAAVGAPPSVEELQGSIRALSDRFRTVAYSAHATLTVSRELVYGDGKAVTNHADFKHPKVLPADRKYQFQIEFLRSGDQYKLTIGNVVDPSGQATIVRNAVYLSDGQRSVDYQPAENK